jgi:general stress protein YciG
MQSTKTMTKAQTLEDLRSQVREEDKMVLHSNDRRARGLAAMSPERRREIASKGGRTSQARGTAHQWTAEEASAAGKKGSARYALRRAEMGGMAQ